jgi:hypothetical protein
MKAEITMSDDILWHYKITTEYGENIYFRSYARALKHCELSGYEIIRDDVAECCDLGKTIEERINACQTQNK